MSAGHTSICGGSIRTQLLVTSSFATTSKGDWGTFSASSEGDSGSSSKAKRTLRRGLGLTGVVLISTDEVLAVSSE
ncbi:hypothetical protein JCM33374_g2753 [Metschnikowia sp. JCM 33374]|nr:hypothetical protein JCM33374_g2753 [Metschnikowia sp. JCM 33374]